MADEMNTDERAAPSDEDFVMIYKRANGEDTGKAQPLTTKRIVNAMRAAFQAGRASTGFTAADMATASAQGFRDGVASLSAAEPAGWKRVPVEPTPKMLAVFDDSDRYFVRRNKENPLSERYEVVDRESDELDVVGLFADDDAADSLAARLSYTEHYRAMLAAAPALTQGVAIAAGAVNKIPMLDSDDPGKALLRTTRGWDFCRNGNMIRSLDEFEIGFVEAALRASHGQAPAQQANTKTHDLLSTMIGMFLGFKEKIGYKPGSAIDNTVAEAVEHLKDWPYPEPTPSPQAAQQAPAGASRFADALAIQRREAECTPSDAYMVGLYNGMSMMDANYRGSTDWEPMSVTQAAPAAPSTPASFQGRVERHSDQSVLVVFPSCRLASEFERSLLPASPTIEGESK